MKMTCRYLYLFCLLLSVVVQPSRAEDESTTWLADPALEAVQALDTDEPLPVVEDSEPATPPAEEILPDAREADMAVMEQEVTPDLPLAKDVVLVLDNSGSMKKNDPQFLGKQAAEKFILDLDEATRIAVIIFDQSVRMAAPLTGINDENRASVLQSLDQIDYKGQWTESPAAIERAIYELKNNARPEAKKYIVFMTDGVVDTGDAARDLEQAKWLKGELADDAANSDIRIFGIAYTENADFLLIQSIAQKTDGEYYRALQPGELQHIFEQINAIVNRVPEPEPVAVEPAPVVAPETREAAPPPAPVIIEVPVSSQKLNEEEQLRSMMILVALAVLIIAVIIMVLMLIRGSRRKGEESEYAQEAFLNDINGYTSQATYKLGNMPTMLGRVAGTDMEHLNYIVIPQTTIGRRHALIEYKDFAYWIIDQGSINGTFVNDQMISSETRLKHGDRIRLHKYEFEFVMPEMVDAGMTVISNTVLAGTPAVQAEDVTIARGNNSAAMEDDLPEPDFDLTGGTDSPRAIDPAEADTIVKESHTSDEDEKSSDDTIMLDDKNETISSGDEDATIRPDQVNDEEEPVAGNSGDNNRKQ